MSETKFTPAPWEVVEDDNLTTCVIDTLTKMTVACIEPNSDIPDEELANAQLIASAPEMYEYLDMIVEQELINDHSIIKEIENLLNKARGEL